MLKLAYWYRQQNNIFRARTLYQYAARASQLGKKDGDADFVQFAKDCVGLGVQVIGGCCGIELDYIRPLREALPSRIPTGAAG